MRHVHGAVGDKWHSSRTATVANKQHSPSPPHVSDGTMLTSRYVRDLVLYTTSASFRFLYLDSTFTNASPSVSNVSSSAFIMKSKNDTSPACSPGEPGWTSNTRYPQVYWDALVPMMRDTGTSSFVVVPRWQSNDAIQRTTQELMNGSRKKHRKKKKNRTPRTKDEEQQERQDKVTQTAKHRVINFDTGSHTAKS